MPCDLRVVGVSVMRSSQLRVTFPPLLFCRGTAVVEFAHKRFAKAAAQQLSGSLLLGQVITVSMLPQRRQPGF